MLASVLRLIGLDKAQEAFKLVLEEKAHEAVNDVKGVVVRMVVVAALAVAAAIFALLAVIIGPKTIEVPPSPLPLSVTPAPGDAKQTVKNETNKVGMPRTKSSDRR